MKQLVNSMVDAVVPLSHGVDAIKQAQTKGAACALCRELPVQLRLLVHRPRPVGLHSLDRHAFAAPACRSDQGAVGPFMLKAKVPSGLQTCGDRKTCGCGPQTDHSSAAAELVCRCCESGRISRP